MKLELSKLFLYGYLDFYIKPALAIRNELMASLTKAEHSQFNSVQKKIYPRITRIFTNKKRLNIKQKANQLDILKNTDLSKPASDFLKCFEQ